MAAMLAAGLSTGTRLYYLVFYALLAMLLLGAVAVVWTLVTLRVTLKGVRPGWSGASASRRCSPCATPARCRWRPYGCA